MSITKQKALGKTLWNFCFAPWLTVLVLLLAPSRDSSAAEPWRILSFDLGLPNSATSGAVSNAINRAAASISERLPDIILVHGAPNWATCERLARQLTSYRVIVCSAFSNPGAKPVVAGQVAILAKQSAYFAWAEGWQHSSGGYAFAAFQTGAARLGFFALSMDGAGNPLEFENEWEDAVAAFRGWETNQLDATVVCAAYGPVLPGRPGAFSSALLAPFPTSLLTNLPMQATVVVQVPSRPERLPAFITTACPASFLLEADARELALTAPAGAKLEALVGANRATDSVELPQRPRPNARSLAGLRRSHLGLSLAAAAVLATATVSILLRRRQAQEPRPAGSAPVVNTHDAWRPRKSNCAPAADAQAQRALSTLAADRTILLEEQQAATGTVLAADELLARVEAQIQQQTNEQQARIDGLNRQLADADAENRLLIQARIHQVKAQMDLPVSPPAP